MIAEQHPNPERLQEYCEIAALACLELDLLKEIATDQSLTADDLRKQIIHAVEKKDNWLKNPISRNQNYQMKSWLFSLPVAK